MWTATLDQKDATAKGGFSRTQIAGGDEREPVDAALLAAAAAHATELGHTPKPVQTFPGATWVYCSCGAAFHANKRR